MLTVSMRISSGKDTHVSLPDYISVYVLAYLSSQFPLNSYRYVTLISLQGFTLSNCNESHMDVIEAVPDHHSGIPAYSVLTGKPPVSSCRPASQLLGACCS